MKTDPRTATNGRVPLTSRTFQAVSMEGAWERLARPMLASLIVAALAGMAAAVVAAGIAATRPATYRSEASLLLDEPAAIGTAPDDGVIIKLSALRNKYVALADTAPIVDRAAQISGLDANTVAGGGTIIAAPDALVMNSQGLSSNPHTAQAVAQGLAESVSQYVANEQDQLGLPAPDRVVVTVIHGATPATRISPSVRRIVAIVLIAGILAALVGYVVAQLVWTRSRPG